MPLTIAGVVAFGTGVMGLSLGAAIVLGAILARPSRCSPATSASGRRATRRSTSPTSRSPARPGLTTGSRCRSCSSACSRSTRAVRGGWASGSPADVLYAIAVGVAIGIAVGHGLGGLAIWLRDRRLLAKAFDGWLAIPERARDLRAGRDRRRLRVRRRLRRRGRLSPAQHTHGAQPRDPRRRRGGGEVRRAGGDPAARQHAVLRRARRAGPPPAGCWCRRSCSRSGRSRSPPR